MAKSRAIIKRLKAVKNIRKITRTMELIATARFKKAMDRATEAAAYTKKLSEIVADLSQANLKFSHPLLQQRDEVKKSVLLVATSNRGLCGGFNGSVLRLTQRRLKEAKANGEELSLEVSGKRGISFLRFQGETMDETYTHFEDKPTFDETEELANRYIEKFIKGEVDRVDVAYVQFQSASKQVPVIETLLPLGDLSTSVPVKGNDDDEAVSNIEYEFLPSAEGILAEIVPAAFKASLFKVFLDAGVSEQIARMVAMKGATENADEMIRDLSQSYNRARQTQITSELSEIIGGAAALE
ncbi:ATP synthase gamma chain [hydrothermal vent metagenome]|uniref:ATP synthase gamma chain n=1 Tax=hydrothermal vent metagenome TaxID=652676 RepID=A0A3B1E2A5_9ZZZZ